MRLLYVLESLDTDESKVSFLISKVYERARALAFLRLYIHDVSVIENRVIENKYPAGLSHFRLKVISYGRVLVHQRLVIILRFFEFHLRLLELSLTGIVLSQFF